MADLSADTPLLAARGLVRDYGRQRAVADFNLCLATGDVVGLLGANGAGKSTVLQMLAGTLAPTAGHVVVAGFDMRTRPHLAKQCLGFLPERPPLYPELSVDEYLGQVARLHRIPRGQRADAIARAKQDTGLVEVGARLIGQLSKGYGQRVGIAQAIVHRPDVLILDEPTAGLDPQQLLGIRALVKRLASRHAVIVSSHILSEIQAVASRVAILAGGRLVFNDDLAALAVDSDWIEAGFVHDPGAAALQALDGVQAVAAIGPGRWALQSERAADLRPVLAEIAITRGWGLHTLGHRAASLEARYLAYTQGEAARDTALQGRP